jgi:hypothetical protein
MSDRASPQTWLLFGIALLAILPAWEASKPGIDVDTWWHLAVGKHIWTTGTLPETDPLSRIGIEEGAPWIAYSWVHELVLYGAHSLLGLHGVLLVRTVLAFGTVLVVAWFATRRLVHPVAALAALGLMTTAITSMMTERPWHITIIITVLTLYAIVRIREGAPARRFWWLPLVYVLWANIHIQFILGLGVLGLAWCVNLVERFRRGEASRAPAGLFWLGVACAVATLANPYHVRLYGVIWEYATQTTPLRTIQELMPPDWGMWWNWPLAVLVGWAIVLLVRRRFPLWDTALLATGIVLSLRMQRDLWFGCLAAVTVIARPADGVAKLRLAGWGVTAAVATAFVIVQLMRQVVATPDLEAFQAESYPAGAVAFVREERLPGPLFNDFNWGGYLSWHLPEHPVSIDGRTNFYGEERLQRILNAWSVRPGWEMTPELVAARIIIAPRTQPLTQVLLEAGGSWRVAYADAVAVVFVRD